ncbi:hypothetical protein SLNWT_2106 [Streptomyces albus]|uniref:Uncharacterized protein n=2 Tax=Streptomyces TaxID=1883 RepID=A0A0B5EWK2_STRA4|nr:hypothetical protein SLNWT_2106 [Streptomyces albus]AOU76796.1 hypothetical protein SLNHY_2105 [Streptomyces albus]
MWCRAMPVVRGYRHTMDRRQHGTAQEPEAEHLVCAQCGAQAESGQVTWTCSVENGTRRYFCDSCARAHIRDIEGRLDSHWW